VTSDASASNPVTGGSAGTPTGEPGLTEPADRPAGARDERPEPATDERPEARADEPVDGPVVARLNRVAVGRPPEMMLGAIFLTFSALPLVLVGLTLLLRLGGLTPGLANAPGILVRFIGLALLLVGVVYVALAWYALKPRQWARNGAAVFAGVEIVMLFIAMLTTAFDPVGIGLILLAGAGAVLMFLPRSAEFLALSAK
jgi:hypothetical protein